jgi:flagellar basal-body rod protein FlgB
MNDTATVTALRRPERSWIAESPAMREVASAADDVAPLPTTVLLLGESGTGKEVLARYIHRRSPRANRPYVAVNCAALPGDLLESELFGHERGAFTGAADRHLGKVELAHGGTLLLDEVSELPLHLQAKLLRVIQERELDRVGGTKPVPVDVRIIATSNRDLEGAVAEGQFRADLFYRLNVYPIHLPALRDRTGDLEPLSRHLLLRSAEAIGRPTPILSASALEAISHYAFPGNVRELGNVLERAIVRCRGEVLEAAHLGLPVGASIRRLPSADPGALLPPGLPLELEALEQLAIAEALRNRAENAEKQAPSKHWRRGQKYVGPDLAVHGERMKLFDKTLTTLEHALDARLMNQNVLAGNLANSNTPSYQPKELNFEAAMAQADRAEGVGDGEMGARTISVEGEMHAAPAALGPLIHNQANAPGGLDGNGVDADRTMVSMAQNGLQYGAVAKAAGKKLSILRYVASDGNA